MTRFPFVYRIGPDGRTAAMTREAHIAALIEQVLFTSPGERVNRPDFGAALREMVFAGNAPELAAATRHMVQGALHRWLGDLVELREVAADADEARLTVRVRYRALDEAEERTVEIVRPV